MLTGPGSGPDQQVQPPPAVPPPAAASHFVMWLATFRRALQRPPRLWQEVVLLTLGFGLYSLIQKDVPLHADDAYDRGRALLNVERGWHIEALNHALARVKPLAVVANYYYVALHFMVPIFILLWLIFRHIDRYRAERRSFVLMALIGLAVFWFFPTAPPRLIPGSGIVDTVSRFHTIGSYESGATKHAADQFASMPSLHLAFALWCAITMFRVGKHPVVRYGWFIYPVLTSVDVVATGNHYVLDLPAGAAALGLGYLISYASSRWARRLDGVLTSEDVSTERTEWSAHERIDLTESLSSAHADRGPGRSGVPQPGRSEHRGFRRSP